MTNKSANTSAAGLAAFRVLLGAVLLFETTRRFFNGSFIDCWLAPEYHFTYTFLDLPPLPNFLVAPLYLVLFLLSFCLMLGIGGFRVSLASLLIYSYFFWFYKLLYADGFYLLFLALFLNVFTPSHRVWALNFQADSLRLSPCTKTPKYFYKNLQALLLLYFFWNAAHMFAPNTNIIFSETALAWSGFWNEWLNGDTLRAFMTKNGKFAAADLYFWRTFILSSDFLLKSTAFLLAFWHILNFALLFCLFLRLHFGFWARKRVQFWQKFAFCSVLGQILFDFALRGAVAPIFLLLSLSTLYLPTTWPMSLCRLFAWNLQENEPKGLDLKILGAFSFRFRILLGILWIAFFGALIFLPARSLLLGMLGFEPRIYYDGRRFAWLDSSTASEGRGLLFSYQRGREGGLSVLESSPNSDFPQLRPEVILTDPDLLIQYARASSREIDESLTEDCVGVFVQAYRRVNGGRARRIMPLDVDLLTLERPSFHLLGTRLQYLRPMSLQYLPLAKSQKN